MSTRRSRYSLSLVRKCDSPKSPVGDRTRSSASENNISTDSCCSTPLNKRKRAISLKCSSPVPYECDNSPLRLSQDASSSISGVSWAWNSPKRVIANDYRHRKKPLGNSNQISHMESESFRFYQKGASDKLTGFYRFESELKLLQERHEQFNEPFEVNTAMTFSSMQAELPTSPQPSPGDNLLLIKNENNETSIKEHRREPIKARCSNASDSFNNSDFDNLLLQAGQAVECDESSTAKYDCKRPLSRGSLIFKPRINPDQSDSFNNSNIDKLLLQATQAFEQQVNTTVILPKLSNLVPGTAQELLPTEKKNFFKSRTTDNFESNSDESFPESELELLLQHVALPKTTKINNENSPGNIDLGNPSVGSWRNRRLLTRHKSMPESPSNKKTDFRTSRCSIAEWNAETGAQSFISISSSLSDTTKPEALTRKCSKEEIEQKRQEALKRQASRLKRLMQGNHSQSEATLFKSNLT